MSEGRPANRSGLRVWHLGEDGEVDFETDFGSLGLAPELAREFADLFESKTGRGGTWRSPYTCEGQLSRVRHFAKHVTTLPVPPRSASDITVGLLNGYGLTLTRHGLAGFRGLIRALTDLSDSSLSWAQTRTPKSFGKGQSYSIVELRMFRQAIAELLAPIESRIMGGLASLPDASLDPAAEVLRLIFESAPPADVVLAYRRYAIAQRRASQPITSLTVLRHRLHVKRWEAELMALAVVAETGWNLTSVLELQIPVPQAKPDNSRRGHYEILLEKRRRGGRQRFESRIMPFRDEGVHSDLLTRINRMVEPTRNLAEPTALTASRLIVFLGGTYKKGDKPKGLKHYTGQYLARKWPETVPMPVPGRLRKTINVVERRSANQNSELVHFSRYVMTDEASVVMSAPSIVEGIKSAVEDAERHYSGMFSDHLTAGQETAFTSCSDHFSNPKQIEAGPCRSSFFLCFSCPNAIVASTNLPKITLLHEALIELRTALDPIIWNARWNDTFERVDDLRLRKTTESQWQDAVERTSADDRRIVNLMFEGAFDA